MKILLVSLIFFFPVIVNAQQPSQQDMQNMMAQMQEMAACMQTIDQNELKGLEKEANKFEEELKGLCKSGKRDEANEKAIAFGKKTMESQALVTMRKCTEKMSESMKGMMPNMDPETIAKDYSKGHVCDQL